MTEEAARACSPRRASSQAGEQGSSSPSLLPRARVVVAPPRDQPLSVAARAAAQAVSVTPGTMTPGWASPQVPSSAGSGTRSPAIQIQQRSGSTVPPQMRRTQSQMRVSPRSIPSPNVARLKLGKPSDEKKDWPQGLLVGDRPPARPHAELRIRPPPSRTTSESNLKQRSPLAGQRRSLQVPSTQSSPRSEPSAYARGSPEARLMQVFGQHVLSALLAGSLVTSETLSAAASLAEQSVTMCIDYARLGQSWKHPHSRGQYRLGSHPSMTCQLSRARAQLSKQRLSQLFLQAAKGQLEWEVAIVRAFMREIGVENQAIIQHATFEGVSAALEAELLLPLRSFNEAQQSMHLTVYLKPVPAAEIREAVQALTAAVVSKPSGFSEWRYTCPRGRRQLEGLSEEQVELWKTATSCQHRGGALRSHEDEAGELGLFWATKIGGPSHGFDIEGQCHLPLLCNARNKVILLSDPALHPVSFGRVHFRLLWVRSQQQETLQPRLWLERLNVDFDLEPEDVKANMSSWTAAILLHAISKSEAMQVPLSVDLAMLDLLKAISCARQEGQVVKSSEVFVLHPSNGVCEASDYLDSRHDWVQLEEEDTPLRHRGLYLPTRRSGSLVQS